MYHHRKRNDHNRRITTDSPCSHNNHHSASSKKLKRTVLTVNSSLENESFDIWKKRIQIKRSGLVGDFVVNSSKNDDEDSPFFYASLL